MLKPVLHVKSAFNRNQRSRTKCHRTRSERLMSFSLIKFKNNSCCCLQCAICKSGTEMQIKLCMLAAINQLRAAYVAFVTAIVIVDASDSCASSKAFNLLHCRSFFLRLYAGNACKKIVCGKDFESNRPETCQKQASTERAT